MVGVCVCEATLTYSWRILKIVYFFRFITSIPDAMVDNGMAWLGIHMMMVSIPCYNLRKNAQVHIASN